MDSAPHTPNHAGAAATGHVNGVVTAPQPPALAGLSAGDAPAAFWDPTEGYRPAEDEDMGDAQSSMTDDDMDFGPQEPAAALHSGGRRAPAGSDSPLFDLPRQDSGPDSSATHAGLPNGSHAAGFRGHAAAGPRQLFSMQDELIPGLNAQPSEQAWQHGSAPHSRASSPGSDLPPGLGPDDMATALADEKLQAVLHHGRQPVSDLIEAVHIPGIGSTRTASAQQREKDGQPALDITQLRELARSPILNGLTPAAAIPNRNSSPAMLRHRPSSSSSLTSLPHGTHQQNGSSAPESILPFHPGAPARSQHHAQPQSSLVNGGLSDEQPERSSHDMLEVVPGGLIPVRPGAVPTEPVQIDNPHTLAHAPSHAANGSWQDREQQRVEAQASWQDLGANAAEIERQAAASLRPRSAQGRPQQLVPDLSLLGDPVDVLLQ